jgi:hypothetical protein
VPQPAMTRTARRMTATHPLLNLVFVDLIASPPHEYNNTKIDFICV